MALLEVRNLTVAFATRHGDFVAVDGVDVTVDRDEVLAIVGESGSGKSVAMLAVMGLLPFTARVDRRRACVRRRRPADDDAGASAASIAGKDMAMIFQEPMSSLNPCFTVGFQIGEALKAHLDLDRRARAQARRRTARPRSASPIRRAALRAFPHQLSGGMSQRVMIAMALACRPKLLIADEPTTALDVTIQAQILDLLLSLKQRNGMALVLITHDMGVVAETADRVIVQYAGQQVEENATDALFADPHHPYTAALLAALPERATGAPAAGDPRRRARPVRPAAGLPVRAALRLRLRRLPPRRARPRPGGARPRLVLHAAQRRPAGAGGRGSGGMSAVIEARGLSRDYLVSRGGLPSAGGRCKALDGVSFSLEAGRTLAVVGESGSGKSTLARLLTLIEPPTAGALLIEGEDVAHADRARRRRLRQDVQMVFQNPYGSLNPRQTDRQGAGGAAARQHPAIGAPSARRRRARSWPRSACGRSSSTAIRTCSPAASASASPSRAR